MSSPTRIRWHLQHLVLPLLLLVTGPACAQLEGTLFTTPEERAYLDYLRQEFLARNREAGFNIETPEVPEIPLDTAAVEAPAPVIFTLGGIITSRDGTRSVWLNQLLLGEDELPRNIRIVDDAGVLALRIADGTNSWLLRSGQTLDLGTGVAQEAWQRQQEEAARASAAAALAPPEPASAAAPTPSDTAPNDPLLPADAAAATEPPASPSGTPPAELAELLQALENNGPADDASAP